MIRSGHSLHRPSKTDTLVFEDLYQSINEIITLGSDHVIHAKNMRNFALDRILDTRTEIVLSSKPRQ